MQSNVDILRNIIFPKGKTLTAGAIGGGIGLAGDLSGFLTQFMTPVILAVIFFAATLIAAWLCLNEAKKLSPPVPDEAVTEVADCRVCEAMRFSLFAVFTFALLMIVGQGQTATETVGEKLGLIHEDVQAIQSEVEGLGEITATSKIVKNPKSAADYFKNAWIYSNVQRDYANAYTALDTMYEKHAPNKLDASELYFNSGRQVKGRDDVLKNMEAIADRNGDATLLVIAGRNASDSKEADRLYIKAQTMSPDLPFAYWDVMRASQTAMQTGVDQNSQVSMLRKQVEGLTVFIDKIANQPAGTYFYIPQHQPDYEQLANKWAPTSPHLKPTPRLTPCAGRIRPPAAIANRWVPGLWLAENHSSLKTA